MCRSVLPTNNFQRDASRTRLTRILTRADQPRGIVQPEPLRRLPNHSCRAAVSHSKSNDIHNVPMGFPPRFPYKPSLGTVPVL